MYDDHRFTFWYDTATMGRFVNLISFSGKEDEKGKIMGIFRSLGALSRALGPFMSCAS